MNKVFKKVRQIVAIVLVVALLPISDYAQVFAYEGSPNPSIPDYPYSHELTTETLSGDDQPEGEPTKEESIPVSVSTNSGNTIHSDIITNEVSDNSAVSDKITISMNADVSEEHQFMLEWEDSEVSSNHFEVYRNDKLVEISEDKTYVEKEIEWGTTYRYYVIAKDQSGQVITKSDVVEYATMEELEYYQTYTEEIAQNTILKSGRVQPWGCLYLRNDSKLVVLEDFVIPEGGTLIYCGADTICGGDFVLENGAGISDTPYYDGENKEAYSNIQVKRNLVWNTQEGQNYGDDNCLSYTTLELRGNFTNSVSDNQLEFKKMIFSGANKQEVYLPNRLNYTKELELSNTSDEGIYFNNLPAFGSCENKTDNVYENEHKTSLSGNTVLSEDKLVEGDYHLYGGSLDLNGHTLHITGDFYQEAGDVVVNKGQLIVDGQYRMQDVISDNHYLPTLATLHMSEEEDNVRVGGDFSCAYGTRLSQQQSYKVSDNDLTNGTFELQGDFNDLNDSVMHNYNGYYYTNRYFKADAEHLVKLSSTDQQVIRGKAYEEVWNYYDYRNDKIVSTFGQLEVNNTSTEGVLFENCPYIIQKFNTNQSVTLGDVRINEITTISGNEVCGLRIQDTDGQWDEYYLPSGLQRINGNITCEDQLNLTQDLVVKGNIEDTSVSMNGVSLTIKGDFERGDLRITQDGRVSVQNCNVNSLMMPFKDSYLLVNGNFSNESSDQFRYENGIIEIKKDLYLYPNIGNKTDVGTYVLSGDTKQTISAGTMQESNYYFKELRFQNTSQEGILLASVIHVQNCSMNDLKIKYQDEVSENTTSGWTLSEDEVIEQDLILSDGILDLNGKTLTIKGNFIQEGGQVLLNGGTLIVEQDYRVQNRNSDNNQVTYQPSFGFLVMDQDEDAIIVEGDFVHESMRKNESKFLKGTITVYGDYSNDCTNIENELILTGSDSHSIGGYAHSITSSDAKYMSFENDPIITGQIAIGSTYISGRIQIKDTTTFQNHVYPGTIVVKDKMLRIEDQSRIRRIDIGENTILYGDFTTEDIESWSYSLSLMGDVTTKLIYGASNLTIYNRLLVTEYSSSLGNVYVVGNLTFGENIYSFSPNTCNVKGKMCLLCDVFYLGGNELTLDGGEIEFRNRGRVSTRVYMTNPIDKIIFNGNAEFYIYNDSNISSGTVEFKKDAFIYGSVGEEKPNFLFSGTTKQAINNYPSNCYVNQITINNSGEEGVVFNRLIRMLNAPIFMQGTLSYTNREQAYQGLKSIKSCTLSENTTISTHLILDEETIDLNGYTLTVEGDLVQNGGKLILNGGTLIVKGNYDQSRDNYGNGVLIMKNPKDRVIIEKNVSFDFFREDTKDNLSAGYIIIKGEYTYLDQYETSKGHVTSFLKDASNNNGNYNQYIYADPTKTKMETMQLESGRENSYNFYEGAKEAVANKIVYGEIAPEIPDTVTQVSANEITETTIQLSYNRATDDQGVRFYKIYRDGVAVGTSQTTTFTDYYLEPDTEYSYTIVTIDQSGNESPCSKAFAFRTKKDVIGPNKIDSVGVAICSASRVQIRWVAPKDNVGVVGYDLYRNQELLQENIQTTYYDDRSVETNQSYDYFVVAKDKAMNASVSSNHVTATPKLPEVESIFPQNNSTIGGKIVGLRTIFKMPIGFYYSVKMEYRTAQVPIWTNVTDKTNYKYYDQAPGQIEAYSRLNLESFTEDTTIDVRYTITDCDKNQSQYTTSLKVDKTAPKTPLNLIARHTKARFNIANPNMDCVKLTWEENDDVQDVEDYRIYRKRNDETLYKNVKTLSRVYDKQFIDFDVANGYSYEYKITATDRFDQESEAIQSEIVYIDTICPTVNQISLQEGKINKLKTFQVMASDNYAVESIELWMKQDNQQEYTLLQSQKCTLNQAEFFWNTSNYPDGVYSLRAVANDYSGNQNAIAFLKTYTIDNTGIAKIAIDKTYVGSDCAWISIKEINEKDFSYLSLERKIGEEFEEIAKISNFKSIKIEGLEHEKTYTYRLVGYDDLDNRGVESDEVTIETKQDKIAPKLLGVLPSSRYHLSIPLEMTVSDNQGVDYGVFSYSMDQKEYVEIEKVYASQKEQEVTLKSSLDVSNMKDGPIYIRYEAYDTSNNKNKETAELTEALYQIDHTPPQKIQTFVAKSKEGYVSLSWDLVSENDVKCYRIYRKTSEESSFQVLEEACVSMPYFDTSGEEGVFYDYKLTVIDQAGNESADSETLSAKRLAFEIAPTAVSSISVNSVSEKSVSISYGGAIDEDGVVGYYIYRNGEKIATTSNQEYQDNNLQPDTNYTYTVFAYDHYQNVAKESPECIVHTLKDEMAPTCVRDLSLQTRSGSALTLTWGAAKDNVKVVGYRIYRNDELLAENVTATTYKDSNLSDKKAYSYSVVAYDSSGNVSSEGNVLEASPSQPMITNITPEDYEVIGDETVDLEVRFKDFGNSVGNQVKIEYYDTVNNAWKAVNSELLEQKRLNQNELYATFTWNIQDIEVEGDLDVRFSVIDCDQNKTSEVVSYIVDTKAPNRPTQLSANDDQGVICLEFRPSSSADCNGYIVYRKVQGEDAYREYAVLEGKGKNQFVDADVTKGMEYSYTVCATDKFGHKSDYAEPATTVAGADTLGPKITSMDPGAGTIGKHVTFMVKGEDNRGIEYIQLFVRKLEEDDWILITKQKAIDNAIQYSWDSSAYADGTYIVKAIGIDQAGNESSANYIRRYELDHTGIQKIVLEESIVATSNIQLKWNDVPEEDFGYFQVEQLVGENYISVGIVNDKLGYVVTNLLPETEYTFRVVGYDQFKNRGVESDPVTLTTKNDILGPTITGVFPVSSSYNNEMELKMIVKDDAGVASGTFSYSLDQVNFTPITTIETKDQRANEEISYKWDLSNLPETQFYVKFEALDTSGNANQKTTEQTDVVMTYQMDRQAPTVVKQFAAKGEEGLVALSWSKAQESDVRSYTILRTKEKEENWIVAKQDCESINYYDSQVELGETYRYKIAAVDIAGNISEYSQEAIAYVMQDETAPILRGISPSMNSVLGKTSTLKILATDNYRLKTVELEYRQKDADLWTTMETLSCKSNCDYFEPTFDASDLLEDKQYEIRARAIDLAGNVSDYVINQYSLDLTAPQKASVSANSQSFMVDLEWTPNAEEDFSEYKIYRKEINDKNYTCINQTTNPTYQDITAKPNVLYAYKISAFDRYGNESSSKAVTQFANSIDTIKPTAFVSEQAIVGVAGREIAFDGGGSSDNVRVASYSWYIQDTSAKTLRGMRPCYTFATPGTYDVTLTVKDSSGNESSTTVPVIVLEPTNIGQTKLTITDLNGQPLPYALVHYQKVLPNNKTEDVTLQADGSGRLIITAYAGAYTISAYAPSYIAKEKTIYINNYEVFEETIALNTGEIVTGDFSVERLELADLLSAGVDLSDPENYYTFKFKTTLIFHETPYPIEIYRPDWLPLGGKVMNDSCKGSVGKYEPKPPTGNIEVFLEVYNNTETPNYGVYYLTSTQSVSWLKDMYEVELGVLNNADSTFTISDAVVSLDLPQGLSLAKTSGGQSLMQNLGEIQGQERKCATWIVKGDQNGEFNIGASFHGILHPFMATIDKRFETTKEFKVSAGEGVEIYVMPQNAIHPGYQHYIQYRIVNNSGKNLYNFKTTIGDYVKPAEVIERVLIDMMTGDVIDRKVRTIGETYRSASANDCPTYPVVRDGDVLEVGVFAPGEVLYGTYESLEFVGPSSYDHYSYLYDEFTEILKGSNLGVQVHVEPIKSHVSRHIVGYMPEVEEWYLDPIDMGSGAFTNELDVFDVPGYNLLSYDLYYNSMLTDKEGESGYGWYSNYDKKVVEEGGMIKLYTNPYAYTTFISGDMKNNIVYGQVIGEKVLLDHTAAYVGKYYALGDRADDYLLEKKSDGTYELTNKGGAVVRFNKNGELSQLVDENGNSVKVSKSKEQIKIVDERSGNYIVGKYNAAGKVVQISDSNNRSVQLAYQNGDLVSYTNVANGVTKFEYKEHRLTKGINANGVTYVQNTYDDKGRVLTQKNANPDSKTATLRYEEKEDGGTIITATDHAGATSQVETDKNQLIIWKKDENGAATSYTYDQYGNVINQRDAYQNAIMSEYDDNNNVVEVLDTQGNITQMKYDIKGNLTEILGQCGDGGIFKYDNKNQIEYAKDSLGEVKRYRKNKSGQVVEQSIDGIGSSYSTYDAYRVSSTTDYLGNKSSFEYDELDRLVKTIDPNGNSSKTEYDVLGRVVKLTNEMGATTSFTYDDLGNQTSVTNAIGNTTKYEYSDSGTKVKDVFSDGSEIHYEYDAMDRVTKITYPNQSTETYQYDKVGNLTQKTLRDGSMYTYEYDLLGHLTKETNPNGVSTSYEYFPNGKVFKTTYPDGTYITNTYDRSWRLIRTTDQDKQSIAYTYDKKGNLLSASDAMGNTAKNEYDVHSRLIKSIDERGNETTYRYDANSNCIETTNALGLITSFDYDAMNRLVKVTTHAKAGDLSVSYKYNAIGQVIETIDEEGHSIHVEYDVLGNVTTLTDALGNVVNKNTYNALNQLKTSEDALGVQTQYQYSPMGDVTEVIECLNTAATKKTTMNYDSSGRLVSVVDPMDKTSSATYDNVGFVKTVTDASGGTTTYNYDDINRLIETVNAIGAKETYTYNSKGLIEEITNSRNQKTQYTYDVLGRIKTLKDEEGSIEYTYDASGNITNVKDKNGTTERTFDALNRVTSITDHNGRSIEYGYDELGNRISLTYPGGEIVRYTYTKTGNLATVTDPDHRKTYYDYDANGRLIQTLRPDGSVEKRSYDAKGQLTKISDQIGSKILLQDSFTYDEAGNITKISKTQDEYADISKLTDALMTYDAQNRMLTYNGETIEYDADGNMTYGPLAGVMTKFTYDCRNRLVQAGDYHYEYNSENVRISAQNKETKWSYLVDPQATYSQILITETYEKNLLGQFSKLTGSTLYTYGLGLISESSEKSGYLVYHFDQLGSTKRITDKDGKTVYTMSYGSYGELFGIQDAKGNLVNFKDNPIAFLYNGQYGIVTDQNTLTYMRARYYNSEIKRFLNQDVLTGSIGNSQSLNRYSYVQGNPIRFTDPFGLCPDGSGVASPKQMWDYIKDAWKTQKGMSWFSSTEERRAAHREVNARHAEAAATVNRAIDAAKQSYKDMTWQEKSHLWLGVIGFIPVIGVAADFVDGCIYLSEGKVGDALFSIGCAAAGLIAGLDQVSDVMKLARMGSKANKVANVGSLIKVSSNIEDFAGIGREGSFLQDVIKGVGVSGDAADGVRTANHAADGIKGANNAVDAMKSASNVGEAVEGGKTTNVINDPIDLADFRGEHILNNHKYGAGKPSKTEFPQDWSDEKILHYVSDVATDPNSNWGMGKWDSPYAIGVREGIEIRVDFYPNTHKTYSGKISTAYPLNTPQNPPKGGVN